MLPPPETGHTAPWPDLSSTSLGTAPSTPGEAQVPVVIWTSARCGSNFSVPPPPNNLDTGGPRKGQHNQPQSSLNAMGSS